MRPNDNRKNKLCFVKNNCYTRKFPAANENEFLQKTSDMVTYLTYFLKKFRKNEFETIYTIMCQG